ncbi:MAG: hypothetical protein EOO60_01850 [Hymenobacter sp.]|nr:MAG: hypothetical protein EOO60_01850 [Hymenobacter sp.]
MLIHSLSFPTGGHCRLDLEKPQGWLRATWEGQVSTSDAMSGAQNYLAHVGPFHCLYLLNDNVALRGPWFDSIEWLERVWLAQAMQLGLRYIAHVVQADTHSDILTLHCSKHQIGTIELQLFDDVGAAEEWLRCCQQPLLATHSRPPLD